MAPRALRPGGVPAMDAGHKSLPPDLIPGHDERRNPDISLNDVLRKPEHSTAAHVLRVSLHQERTMGGLIYLVGLIVVILFILSLLGLR